jgi:hypothetical protein
MNGIDTTSSSRGWPLFEALERTDPDLWRGWTEGKAAFQSAAKPVPSGPSAFITRSPNELRRLKEVAERAFVQARNALWDKLTREQLAGFASRNSSVEPPTPIYSGGWSSLVGANWEKSILRERGKDGAKVFNVRIYPLIHSPDAPSRLAGRSLAQAFWEFVIQDPEVASLGRRIVLEEPRHAAVFAEGKFPGFGNEFKWPLNFTPKDLAYDFVRSPIYFIDDPLPQASSLIQQVSAVIVDRFLALKRHLVDGNVIARGTYMLTGVVGTVDPLQWARSEMFIDVRDGSLLAQENHKNNLLWSGLTLVNPLTFQMAQAAKASNVFHVEPTAHAPVPRNTTKAAPSRRVTATMESIAEAVRMLWPNGVPKGMAVQQRDQRIIDWQKETGLAVASPRSIARYFENE